MKRLCSVLAFAIVCFQLSAQKTWHASLFGVKSDGVTDNTACFQKAVDWIAEQGGGTLELYVGRYLTGAVQLKSGVSIYLREGAVVVGSPNIYAYKGAPGLFWAEGESGVKIYGLGIIEGNSKALSNSLEAQKRAGHLPENHTLPEMVSFKDCTDSAVDSADPSVPGSEGVRFVPDRINSSWPKL